MKTLFKILAVTLLTLLIALLLAAALGYWYARDKLPQREGELYLSGLTAPVQVRWDERQLALRQHPLSVPHSAARGPCQTGNEAHATERDVAAQRQMRR